MMILFVKAFACALSNLNLLRTLREGDKQALDFVWYGYEAIVFGGLRAWALSVSPFGILLSIHYKN